MCYGTSHESLSSLLPFSLLRPFLPSHSLGGDVDLFIASNRRPKMIQKKLPEAGRSKRKRS